MTANAAATALAKPAQHRLAPPCACPVDDEALHSALNAALQRLRQPHWPTSLAAVLSHPLYGALVYGYAIRFGATSRGVAAVAAPVGAPKHAARAPWLPRLQFDPRRAAANDIDD
jgi:DNA-binding IclR family transcriptional regulator